jgi:hypothetical protein
MLRDDSSQTLIVRGRVTVRCVSTWASFSSRVPPLGDTTPDLASSGKTGHFGAAGGTCNEIITIISSPVPPSRLAGGSFPLASRDLINESPDKCEARASWCEEPPDNPLPGCRQSPSVRFRLPFQPDCEAYNDSIAVVQNRLSFLTPEAKQWILGWTAEATFFSP